MGPYSSLNSLKHFPALSNAAVETAIGEAVSSTGDKKGNTFSLVFGSPVRRGNSDRRVPFPAFLTWGSEVTWSSSLFGVSPEIASGENSCLKSTSPEAVREIRGLRVGETGALWLTLTLYTQEISCGPGDEGIFRYRERDMDGRSGTIF